MRRLLLVLAVAALIAAMTAVSAIPAFAKGSQGAFASGCATGTLPGCQFHPASAQSAQGSEHSKDLQPFPPGNGR